ncbi:hypothetical protein V5738_13265 [Salinisphaera sp. SPP-AMP-43]|uniref:hypothetical protein n=1 Tax=Salinisphaera sp. SPP-AMP-43 TaxID=3121288 RepID=UPI003C6E8C23
MEHYPALTIAAAGTGRRRWLGFVLALGIALLGSLVPRPGLAEESDADSEQIHCRAMKWIRYKDQAKAALTVPIMLNGRLEWFQLDTGTPYTMLHGEQLARDYGAASASQSRLEIEDVRLAGVDLGRRTLHVLGDHEPNENYSGTLGLDMLMGHLVILNFPDQRFCMIEDALPSEAMMRRTLWAKGVLRDGHLFFDINFGDHVLSDVLFDTGSSNIALWVDHPAWSQMTGIDDPENAAQLREGMNWGRKITMAGAPAKNRLRLGPIPFRSQIVSTAVEQPDFFNGFANGLFGNAPFFGDIVVLSLGPTPALGVIRR